MKTTVEIADPLLREAKQLAEREGVTLRELIELGLQHIVAEHKTKPRPYKLADCRNRHAKLQPSIRPGDWGQLRGMIYPHGFDDQGRRVYASAAFEQDDEA